MQKTKLSASYEPGMPNQLIIHMDEAGRGPLAGPIAVGAVIALEGFDRSIYKDSKTLSEKKREEYYAYMDMNKNETPKKQRFHKHLQKHIQRRSNLSYTHNYHTFIS